MWQKMLQGGSGSVVVKIIEALIPRLTVDSSNVLEENLVIPRTGYRVFDENDGTKAYSMHEDICLGYQFDKPVCVKKYTYKSNTDSPFLPPTNIKLQYSLNNGSNWIDVPNSSVNPTVDINMHTVELESNNITATYWRIYGTQRPYSDGSKYAQLSRLQFYGYEE